MEKSRRRLLCHAAPATALLIILIPLLDFFGPDNNGQPDHKVKRRSHWNHSWQDEDRRKLESTGYGCDRCCWKLHRLCIKSTGKDRHPQHITVYTSSSGRSDESSVRPYALQKDNFLLQWITPVKVLQGNTTPPACEYNHTVPAVIFTSGIVGNLFHEFNDIIIPFFITSRHFQSRVLLILDDYNPRFVSKILSRLSSHEIVNPAANASIHCLPGVVLGLKFHDNLGTETYGLKFAHVSQIRQVPTLVLISRERSRNFLNEEEIVGMVRELGFRVVVARTKEAVDLDKFGNVINSCAVLVGVHGAGLTNELFLQAGAVTVQVEPLGLEWAAEHYFGEPANRIRVHCTDAITRSSPIWGVP